jgi:methylmalonyl-CoA mutase
VDIDRPEAAALVDATLVAGSGVPGQGEWERLAAGVLKGASVEKLVRSTRDGIPVRPLYTREGAAGLTATAGMPGGAPFVRGAGDTVPGWDVWVHQAHPDPRRANALMLEALAGGAASLDLALWDGATGRGTVVLDLPELEQALAGVHLDMAPLALDAEARFAEAAALVLALAEARGHDRSTVRLALNADPIGAALRSGGPEPEADLAIAVDLARLVLAEWPEATALLADGRLWHAAGATPAQELAAVLGTAVAYLRALEVEKLPLDEVAGQIAFTLAVDADLFMGVAKLRALRRLWGGVLQTVGAEPAMRRMRVHAETAASMYARRDPWVNILRGTVACFAAATGGADSITVLPFDHALGLPSRLALRLARNTQLILLEESNLSRVADPAGGAWYVETLTEELAQKAWALFQELEAAGGMLAACRAGLPQAWAAESWAVLARDIATRRQPLTGISEFPSLHELPVTPEAFDASDLFAAARDRRAAAVTVGSFDELLALARAGKVPAAALPPSTLPPLPSHRLGEAFERLRDRSDLALARDGQRPRIFLANLGPPAQHTARATFAKNLLEAGGIETTWSGPLSDAAGAVQAWRESGTRIATLCSSDEVYADLAVQVAEALSGAGCVLVCLLGQPDERRGALEAAGVGLFVHAGCDMVEILTGLHNRQGTPRLESAP